MSAHKITEPGIYALTSEEYHADNFMAVPTLSNSIAKLLVNRTPRHAWTASARLNPNFQRVEEGKFDIGNAGHSLMLNDVRAFEVIDADDWRSGDAKKARSEARKAGRIPLLTEQFARTQAMVAAGRAQLLAHEDAADAFTDGTPEATLVWQEGGVWCRARADWKPNDPTRYWDDYKTTESADPDTWQRIAFNMGYDVQAAFYRRGIRALGLTDDPRFRFIVQEVDEPHALCAIALMPGAVELGEAKVDRALALWKQCLKENRWPGYPNKTCYIAAPSWHETQWLDRQVRESDRADGPGRQDLLAHAIEWQAPLA